MADMRRTFNGEDVEKILADVAEKLEANLDKSDTVAMQGTAVKKADLLEAIAARRQPYHDVKMARLELGAKIAARDTQADSTLAFVKQLDAGIAAKVGTNPTEKAKYGLPIPKAKRQLTVEELASRAAKMRATRKLRKTLGARQKEKLKATGDFTVKVSSTTTVVPSNGSEAGRSTASPVPGAVDGTANGTGR